MEVTPPRKSPRFTSTIHSPSRPSFDLNAYTPSPPKRASSKVTSDSKGKRKMADVDLPHDSDFEDEVPLSKRAKLHKAQNSPPVAKAKKSVRNSKQPPSASKKSKQPKGTKAEKKEVQDTKKATRWCSYVNVKVFEEISEFLTKFGMLDRFKSGPFGNLLDLAQLSVQPQVIRAMIHYMTNKDNIGDFFIFNLNGEELTFGLREFRAVTGLKCGPVDDYTINLSGRSRLIERYFPMVSDRGLEKHFLISAFREGLFEEEDVLHIAIIYFISTYILSSPPKKHFIPIDHFLLVESGQYQSYPWGRRSFFDLRDCIVRQLSGDPDYFKFCGFPLALQIWLYECSNKVDPMVAVRLGNRSPRVFNWTTPDSRLYYDRLLRGMFRRYGSQYKFQRIQFHAEEVAAFEYEQLEESKMDDPDVPQASAHPAEDVVSRNIKKLSEDIVLVRQDFKDLELKVEAQIGQLKAYIQECFQNLVNEFKFVRTEVFNKQGGVGIEVDDGHNPVGVDANVGDFPGVGVEVDDGDNPVDVDANVGDFEGVGLEVDDGDNPIDVEAHVGDFQNPIHEVAKDFEGACQSPKNTVSPGAEGTSSAKKTPTLDDFELPEYRESQIVALENKIPYVTPTQRERTKAPGRFGKSPYTDLSSSACKSSEPPVYFQLKHPFAGYGEFEVNQELVDLFNKWFKDRLSKKRGRRASAFTISSNKINPPFDFGVDSVGLMDWFHVMVTTGSAWTDSHVNVLMYYLRKKCKYGDAPQRRVTTTDTFFMNWVEQIHDIWTANNRDSTLITEDHDVAQYIRGYKILANTPWDKVDYVCIPVHVPEKCHWVLVVFYIQSRCLFIFDSLSEAGSMHNLAVIRRVKKVAEIIPLFLVSTGFYGKRDDIAWQQSVDYAEYALSDSLTFVTCDDIPQQDADSNDCGLFTCVFAELVCNGYDYVQIGKKSFDPAFCRLRYGSLLWDYGTKKIENGAISESEVTGKVVSRFGGPRRQVEHVGQSERVPASKYVPRRKS